MRMGGGDVRARGALSELNASYAIERNISISVFISGPSLPVNLLKKVADA